MFTELRDVSNMYGCFGFGRFHAVDLRKVKKMIMVKLDIFCFFGAFKSYIIFRCFLYVLELVFRFLVMFKNTKIPKKKKKSSFLLKSRLVCVYEY